MAQKGSRKRGPDGKFAPKEEKKDPVLEVMQQLNENLKALNTRVTEMEGRIGPQTATEQIKKVLGEEKKEEPAEDTTLAEMKIHPKHRSIVDEILGEQFQAWESYEGTNSTHFLFNIQVPTKLSSMPQKDREQGRELDIRTKAISNAEGENGVREWCKLVRKNLNKFYSENAIPSPFKSA